MLDECVSSSNIGSELLADSGFCMNLMVYHVGCVFDTIFFV